MELNEENLYKYKNGLLTIDERLDFEDLLDANPEYKKRLTPQTDPTQQNLKDNIILWKKIISETPPSRFTVFKSKVADLYKSFLETGNSFFPKPAYARIAFAAVVVLLIGGWLYNFISHNNNQALADKGINLFPPEIYENHAGATTATDTLCNCGKQAFRYNYKGEPAPKPDFVKQLRAFSPTDEYQKQCKNYFEGWLSIDADNYAAAIPYFEAVWKSTTIPAVRQEAAHGLIIAYLQQNDRKKAQELARILQTEPELAATTSSFIKEVLK